jgi:hypothetical protein
MSAPDPAGRDPWRAPWPALGLGLGLELLFHVLDLLLGPHGAVHWEERFNARAGVFFACGHVDAADALQYRTFCGGCTAEGLAAAPLFRALGPTVLVWKGLLTAIHMGITAAGAALVARAATPFAGLCFVALIAAAPGWYRELSHTGWGNHYESTLFPLLAALLLPRPGEGGGARGAAVAGARATLAGAVAGLGLWFGQTSAWALPGLAAAGLATLGGRGRIGGGALGLAGAAGFGLGMVPWWIYYRDKPDATDATLDWWTGAGLAPPAALLDWLGGAWLRGHIWDPAMYGELGAAPGLWWAGLWALALLGGARLAAQLRWGEWVPDRVGSWLLLVSPLALIAAYALRHDLWHNLPDPYANPAFNLRYRTPLVPVLGLLAAVGAGWPWARRRLRWPARAGGLLLILYGLTLRASTWTAPRAGLWGLRVFQHEGWPDRTTPLGLPPQPLVREQGRPVDVRAAVAWRGGHADPLADCALAHSFELGRRAGLALADPGRVDAVDLVAEALAAAPGPADREQLSFGLARGLVRDSGEQVSHLGRRLDELDALEPGLGARTGALAGRRASGAFSLARDAEHAATLDPRLWAGVCGGRGGKVARALTTEGLHPPALDRLPALVAEAGACAGGAAWAAGLAAEWGRLVGCGDGEVELLEQVLGHPVGDEARAELALACALHRE